MIEPDFSEASNKPSAGITEEELALLRQVQVLVNRQPLPWRGEIALGERERLQFEIDIGELPLDIYSLSLELERDEQRRGVVVEWNIDKAFHKSSTRDWQKRMQDDQYVGDCSVTLIYRGLPIEEFTTNIRLQVTRLAEQHLEYMREVLREQNEKVLYSKRGRTHELSLLAGERTAAMARYEIVMTYYRRLTAVLPDILDHPHHELRQYVTYTAASSSRALTNNSLRLAARSGAMWQALPGTPALPVELEPLTKPDPRQPLNRFQEQLLNLGSQLAARRKARPKPAERILPRRVPVPRLEESYDTYENRFLKMTIKKLTALAHLVQEQLEQERKTALREKTRVRRLRAERLERRLTEIEASLVNLKKVHARLHKAVSGSFLAELGALGPRRTSVVLRENRYYRQIRQIMTEVEEELDVVSSTVGLEQTQSLRLSSINRLYEYWVTVVVLQTMVEKLGFTIIAKEGKPLAELTVKARFNYILQNGSSMELISPLGKRVLVYYDREYTGGWQEKYLVEEDDEHFEVYPGYEPPIYYGYYAPSGMGSEKRRPDIAIEVFDERERVPKIVVIDATYSRDRRTLYSKYEYRDTIRDFTKSDVLSGTPARPVVAAWVVYPEEPAKLEHDEFRYGQLPLQPGKTATNQMAQVLRAILRLAGALE